MWGRRSLIIIVVLGSIIGIKRIACDIQQQQCHQKDKNHADDPASTCGSEHGRRNSTTGGDEPEKFILETRMETGLEFLQTNPLLDFNETMYFQQLEQLQDREHLMGIVGPLLAVVKGSRVKVSVGDVLLVSGSSSSDNDKKPEWAFYPYLLRKLAKVEIEMYHILKRFYEDGDTKDSRETPPGLESYLRDIEGSSLRAIAYVEKAHATLGSEKDGKEDPYLYIATHPLLIYRMIRRFAQDLQPILAEIDNSQEDLIMELYESGNPELLIFPTSQDLADVLASLFRIQDGTNLKTDEFANGILDKVHTGMSLNALNALEIGAYMHDTRYYDYAIQWLHLALTTISSSPVAKTYPAIERLVQKCLEYAIDTHNQAWQSQHLDRWRAYVFHERITLPYNPNVYVRMYDILKPEAASQKHKEEWNWAINRNFIEVCSGASLLSEEEKVDLKCWHQRSHDSYWLINPLKMELLHMDPPVFQVYDFIGDKLIKEIKDAAWDGLRRSTVVDRSHPTRSVVDSTRTSSQVWVYDDQETGRFMETLTRRLELMSKLTILPSSASDAYQVATYGPSHHYAAHIDSFEDPRRCELKGNRITTIMGYLSEVKAGGRTGFPVLGVAADPVKGSFVMWDSLKRNGEDRDTRTWHGGCPVILGTKWITNKWVYYKDNFVNFKCGLSRDM